MYGLFHSLFKRRGKNDPTIQDLPWLSTPSIWLHVRKHIDPTTGKLKPEGEKLPDDERRTADIKMRWAAGALDGVFGHHTGANHDPAQAKKISSLVMKIGRSKQSDQAKINLYKLLLRDDLLTYIDLVVNEVLHAKIESQPRLQDFITFLLHEAPDRGPVKFAIAMSGIIQNEGEVETIAILGRHEEFTLYAAVALSNIMKDPELQLWKMAQTVSGWGRIHLVERLAKTQKHQIKEWLLREGYKNNIMYEYLAFPCAVGGGLRLAMETPEIDADLLKSAGEIIEALINGGPAEDIEDYDDAPAVLSHYLRHLKQHANRLEHFTTAHTIYRYLIEGLRDPIERNEKGWSEDIYENAVIDADYILKQPFWRELVQDELNSEDEARFYLADRVAQALGIDTWDKHWTLLNAEPLSSRRWFYVMRNITPDHASQAIQLAATVLDLSEITSEGEGLEESRYGMKHPHFACLDVILQGLGEFPGLGWPLVAAGLKSHLVSNRNKAVQVLGKWGKGNWTDEMHQALLEAYHVEPMEKVKEFIQKVLQSGMIN
jgi:hypothetical protein